MKDTLPLLQQQKLDEISTDEEIGRLVRILMVEMRGVFDYFRVMWKSRSKEIKNKTVFNEA